MSSLVILGDSSKRRPSIDLISRCKAAEQYCKKHNCDVYVNGTPSEIYWMKKLLDNVEIKGEVSSNDTISNIVNAWDYLNDKNNVIILTSDYHVRRVQSILNLGNFKWDIVSARCDSLYLVKVIKELIITPFTILFMKSEGFK